MNMPLQPKGDTAMTTDECAELAQLESVIQVGLQTFYEVGNALATIRDKGLYQDKYDTFEEYCRERWRMSDKRAYQLIGASQIYPNLSTHVEKPTTEYQLRPLTGLSPEQQIETWDMAVESANGKQPTASQVKAAKELVTAVHNAPPEAPVTHILNAAARLVEKTSVNGGYFDVDGVATPAEADLTDETRESMLRKQMYIAEAGAKKAHVANNSGENEWYTPPKFIEAARACMGDIDLDPATSEVANLNVQATTIFTLDDDGLLQDWYGRVWLNPPYAQPLITQFCAQLASEYKKGHIEQACVLVNNATETEWFQSVLSIASRFCLVTHRVKFIDPAGNPSGAPLQGQVILYIGDNSAAFEDNFAQFGTVCCAVR